MIYIKHNYSAFTAFIFVFSVGCTHLAHRSYACDEEIKSEFGFPAAS